MEDISCTDNTITKEIFDTYEKDSKFSFSRVEQSRRTSKQELLTYISQKNIKAKYLINQHSGKTHPIDRSGFFSKLFINWVTPFVLMGNKTIFTQSLHSKLSKSDTMEYNSMTFKKFLAEQQKPNTQINTNPEFNKDLKINGDQLMKIFSLHKWDLLKNFMLEMVQKFCEFAVILLIYFIMMKCIYYMEEVNYHGMDENYTVFIWYFAGLSVVQLSASLISNYNNTDMSRTSLRIHHCVTSLIYEKVFLINPNLKKVAEAEIEIINHIQSDANKLLDLPQTFVYFTACIMECSFGFIFGIYLFEWHFLVFISAVLLFGLFGSFLYSIYVNNLQDLYDRKTKTQS